MEKRFKDISISLGDCKRGSKTKVEWFFEEGTSQSDIAYYIDAKGKMNWALAAGCGCTTALIATATSITGMYTPTTKDKGLVDKKPTVYFFPKNEQGIIERIPVTVKNEKGVMVFNPKLPKMTLFFNANVID